ncbi:helix-turn-helix domain-containing protein [Flavobacterium sp. HSC-61S13]|uniref:helix-turn-helix domain-containing protein n=1 Tax=Flavobacterium sp. HSC-61S13 TaxID=2910963 RepID=UPI00209E27AE|nr:helix-turn-helix domain-containing protein [Flavobacterium sp. HSC-61S13]MCP1996618.1 excisionase family DNA binding protein [Flavobacterium sp. HSC-61S13]
MACFLQIELSDEQLRTIALHIQKENKMDQFFLPKTRDEELSEEVLTLKQVSELTKVNTRTLLSHIKSDLLKAHKVGSQWRVTRKQLKDYAEGI